MSNPYQEAAGTLIAETGVTIRKWRSGNSGRAYTRDADWGIEAPMPRGPISFGIFAHEVGHQLLHREGAYSRPRWRKEVEAEEYALAQFDRLNLAGRDRYEAHAARHLGYAFAKAKRRSVAAAAAILEMYPDWWSRAEEACS